MWLVTTWPMIHIVAGGALGWGDFSKVKAWISSGEGWRPGQSLSTAPTTTFSTTAFWSAEMTFVVGAWDPNQVWACACMGLPRKYSLWRVCFSSEILNKWGERVFLDKGIVQVSTLMAEVALADMIQWLHSHLSLSAVQLDNCCIMRQNRSLLCGLALTTKAFLSNSAPTICINFVDSHPCP